MIEEKLYAEFYFGFLPELPNSTTDKTSIDTQNKFIKLCRVFHDGVIDKNQFLEAMNIIKSHCDDDTWDSYVNFITGGYPYQILESGFTEKNPKIYIQPVINDKRVRISIKKGMSKIFCLSSTKNFYSNEIQKLNQKINFVIQDRFDISQLEILGYIQTNNIAVHDVYVHDMNIDDRLQICDGLCFDFPELFEMVETYTDEKKEKILQLLEEQNFETYIEYGSNKDNSLSIWSIEKLKGKNE